MARLRQLASCVRRVVAAVPGLLLVLGVRRPGRPRGLPGAGGHVAPVALAVLVDEAHFRPGQQLGQLLVGGGGGAGACGRRGAGGGRWEEGSVDSVPAQHMQLHSRDDVFEVVLGGGAGVQAAIARLQGAKQQALFRAQEAVLRPDLRGQGGGLRGRRPPAAPTSSLILIRPPVRPCRGGVPTRHFHVPRKPTWRSHTTPE